MIPFARAGTFGAGKSQSTAKSGQRPGGEALLEVVWRNGRIGMMRSPLWVHVVGVDRSPAAMLMHRMDLDLARWQQQALLS